MSTSDYTTGTTRVNKYKYRLYVDGFCTGTLVNLTEYEVEVINKSFETLDDGFTREYRKEG